MTCRGCTLALNGSFSSRPHLQPFQFPCCHNNTCSKPQLPGESVSRLAESSTYPRHAYSKILAEVSGTGFWPFLPRQLEVCISITWLCTHPHTNTLTDTHTKKKEKKKKKGHMSAKVSTLANVRPGLCSGGQLPKVTGSVKTHRSHLHTVCCYSAAISLIESQ